MLRGKENNAGDAKVWSVEDDLVVYDHLKSYMPGPKLAKSPKVAALVAKLSASADEIVARFLALDAMSEVRSLELGSNTSIEGKSRDHSLGLMVTFAGHGQRQAYLKSAERAEFNAFVEPFVSETFVFDFESGGVE